MPTWLRFQPPPRVLVRLETESGVVGWGEATPTPRQPNDGTSWEPPDAGVSPDAAPPIDAGPPVDAGRRTDAAPRPSLDAGNSRYLDLDTVGGASCGCQSGQASGAGGLALAREHVGEVAPAGGRAVAARADAGGVRDGKVLPCPPRPPRHRLRLPPPLSITWRNPARK